MYKPENIHYRAVRTLDSLSARACGTSDRVREEMARYAARSIAHNRVREERRAFHTDYILDLYICDPDTFWEVVTEEARRISLGQISLRYEWEPETLR